MLGLTEYRFDGSGSSDPDQDSLTYNWDFGDGSRGTGITVTHVYTATGTFGVTLTVSDGKEQVTTTGSVTVTRNLEGTWEVSGDAAAANMTLTQNRARLSGRYSQTTRSGMWSVSGSIDSSSNFVCPCGVDLSLVGPTEVQFNGTVDNGANTISGSYIERRAGSEVNRGNISFSRR